MASKEVLKALRQYLEVDKRPNRSGISLEQVRFQLGIRKQWFSPLEIKRGLKALGYPTEGKRYLVRGKREKLLEELEQHKSSPKEPSKLEQKRLSEMAKAWIYGQAWERIERLEPQEADLEDDLERLVIRTIREEIQRFQEPKYNSIGELLTAVRTEIQQ